MAAHTQSAAGLVVAALAVVALASARPETAEPPRVRSPRVATSTAARALRDGEPLDLNRAQHGDLILLPFVGPKLAERILEERTRRGGFRAPEDLLAVRGIGPATFERISKLVVVHAPQAHRSNKSAPETLRLK